VHHILSRHYVLLHQYVNIYNTMAPILPCAKRRTRSPRMESAAVVDGALLASGGGVSPPSTAMESAAAAVGGAVVASGGGVSPSNAVDVGAATSTSEKPVSRVISEQFSLCQWDLSLCAGKLH
jgi:hypothetical protein